MIHKRPFLDENSFEFPCKQPKQWESADQLAPIVDMVPSNDSSPRPQIADNEGEQNGGGCQEQGRFACDSVTEGSNGTYKDFEVRASGRISQLPWTSDSLPEPGSELGEALHFSFFPEYFAPSHQPRALLQPVEIYSSLLDSHPLKQIPIGPEHQADVPEWGLHGSHVVDDGNHEKLMGFCVIPMPDSDASADYCLETQRPEMDCKCLGRGSIECVRVHVMEVREKLRDTLGQKIFEELGFCEMGEVVSVRWTEEEELKFNEVVFSNPSSMAKNFWNHLSEVFPSRTKKELISYYFNVFILRKRAEQNRFDPLTIDSDDDEWQRSGVGAPEEDDDSGVESLPRNETSPYNMEHFSDHCEIDDDNDNDANAVHIFGIVEVSEVDIDDISASDGRNSAGDNIDNTDSESQNLDKVQKSFQDSDTLDDSCTTYESQQDKVDDSGRKTRTDGKQFSQE